jgi:dTDP-4-amino-4,6-dideoxygalactose transaminase
MSGEESTLVQEAFASNYIAPIGPMVDAFEREFSAYTGIPHCVALTSGTAATHLALREALERRGLRGKSPVVIASTLTFIGSVSPATFEGCALRFIDAGEQDWNMDPVLLEAELEACRQQNRPVAAVIPTDLYGHPCDLPRIRAICDSYDAPLICDSAEAMGARLDDGRHAGNGAWAAIYSFNGNKIITTSGGGMLASHDRDLIEHARKLSQQARDPAPHYEHTEVGYNYRMSNILAAIGRGQLRALDDRVRRKREIFARYQELLADLPGISFMPTTPGATHWLTVILIDPARVGLEPETIRLALEAENIEARPVWKPMHLQPVFANCAMRGGAVSERIFRDGLCLPSGTAMDDASLDRVTAIIREVCT